MNEKNNKKIASGLFWTFGERISAQLVTTVVSIILARLLDPEHYGIISIVTVFISLCNVFVTSGFSSSVVRSKSADEKDFNTAFWLSFLLSGIIYGVLFISAPAIARFYNMSVLDPVIKVMGIRLPLAAINTIQQAYVRRKMIFKKFFFATLLGTVLSGVVGICLAYAGFGVWALVGQYLTNTTVDTIVLWFVCGWRPKFQFSSKSAKGIFSFGWKVLATDLVSTLENDIRSLIIGKVFSTADLAFYDQGKKYPALIVNNINTSINKVMLPAYAKSQDNLPELRKMLSKSIQIGSFFLAPVLIGFAAVSNQFVSVVLTDKWNAAIPYFWIFCIAYLTRPLETACHQALLAIEKSDVVLKIMIVINTFTIVSVLVATYVFENVLFIALGSLLGTIISLTMFMCSIRKKLSYPFLQQIKDMIPSFACAAVMFVVVKAISMMHMKEALLLGIEIVLGGIVYIICAYILKIEIFMSLLTKIKRK